MEINPTTENSKEQTEAYKIVEKVAKQTNFIKYRDSSVESFRSLYLQIFKHCKDLVRKAKTKGKSYEEIIKMVKEVMLR